MQIRFFTNKLLITIVTVILISIAWQALSMILETSAFPPPGEALQSFGQLFFSDMVPHLLISLYRVGVSLIIAALLGIPLGLFLGKNKRADQFSAPFLYLTFPVPKVVFLPIFLILLGIGNVSKIVMITLIVFYQIVVTTRDAARNVQQEYVLSVKSLKASPWDLYQHVYFPACLPSILTSLKLGLGTAMAILFLVETYATQEGIGFFIMNSWSSLAYDKMFAGIIAMGLMGFLLYLLLDTCEKVFCSWVNP
ncbi:ABC-type nitrate/sulfonate/bicarbonate transport system, permease component [Desulfitobacterium dichloroeliminans LMG P-21439]|uniref:ABC-type nitrate/sulfonate/bicarbonate transport system, permease component n=1 Tax=Desulfitobacterium dichloroeliminans (strain LMG P-21439 / DCA1) TaxID=871963 RepID=L0F9C2_DESDL|nr:ABC transporter permease [Desulfitobacterium dichloroeliminans]AGA69266.1 ABC-type nitrate/sulfonate/bicarbonate transport system, permease component [Desulfitobacterium dichloroeliminans LMG P-21439]